jgi:hypothetical protein
VITDNWPDRFQGLFVFVFYVILREDLRSFWMEKFKHGPATNDSVSTPNTKSTSVPSASGFGPWNFTFLKILLYEVSWHWIYFSCNRILLSNELLFWKTYIWFPIKTFPFLVLSSYIPLTWDLDKNVEVNTPDCTPLFSTWLSNFSTD